MMKLTARITCLALLLFTVSATPLTANADRLPQFDGGAPYPCIPTPQLPNCLI
jgi:hypothetical protein